MSNGKGGKHLTNKQKINLIKTGNPNKEYKPTQRKGTKKKPSK